MSDVIEENGHRWLNASPYSRCVYCQMKYGYYLEIKKASEQQPERDDLKEWLKCPRKKVEN